MYTLTKVAALCAHLYAQQQVQQETYNRFAFYSRGMPMAVVAASSVAVDTRRAALRFAHYCQ